MPRRFMAGLFRGGISRVPKIDSRRRIFSHLLAQGFFAAAAVERFALVPAYLLSLFIDPSQPHRPVLFLFDPRPCPDWQPIPFHKESRDYPGHRYFLYYDLDRFSFAEVPTDIQIYAVFDPLILALNH